MLMLMKDQVNCDWELCLMLSVFIVSFQIQYLIQECATLIVKCNFVSVFCYAVDNSLHHQKVGMS